MSSHYKDRPGYIENFVVAPVQIASKTCLGCEVHFQPFLSYVQSSAKFHVVCSTRIKPAASTSQLTSAWCCFQGVEITHSAILSSIAAGSVFLKDANYEVSALPTLVVHGEAWHYMAEIQVLPAGSLQKEFWCCASVQHLIPKSDLQ